MEDKRNEERTGEELVRTERREAKASGLSRTAGLSIRLLLGAILAGGELFGGGAPFAVGLVAASGAGTEGLFALIGSALGYLFFHGVTPGLRFAAACLLVFSVAFAFYDVGIYRRSWFMPLMAALMDAATGFVYLSDSNWDVTQVTLLVTEVLLSGASAVLYRSALVLWRDQGETASLSARQTVSFLFLPGTLLVSLSGIVFFGELSLGRVLAAAAVMATAYAGGLGVGATVGVALGLGLDLAVGGGGFYTMAWGFAGLLTGAGWKQGKLLAALAFVTANAAAVLWTWAFVPRMSALYEGFLASVLFFLLPEKRLRRLGALLTHEGEGRSARRAAEYVSEKLTETAKAFRGVRDSLKAAFPAGQSNDGDPARVFDRAAAKVCAGCTMRSGCWEKDYVSTFNALNDALPTILERGKGEAADFPGWFAARCVHFVDFLRAVNEETVALRYRQQYRNRLQESRGAVCRQYDTLSEILSSAAAELGAELTPDPLREKKLRRRMSDLGVEGETAVYYDAHGHLRLELEGEGLDKLTDPRELRRLSDLMGVSLRQAEDVPGRVTLTQAEPLMAVAGVAARRREGQTESGDTGTWFKRGDGSLFVLLCDGMGSGEWAHRESALAVRLLEEFLRSGMESAAALRTVNAALALRNEESGAFTTVDLLRVDLYTGEGEVCKLGAAPTYLRREGEVKRLTGCALPAGLADGSPDVTALALAPGDCVLLVSDGVADMEDDGWLRELLTGYEGDSPKELARQVMEGSEERVGAADDRTAVVIQIKNR